MMMMMMVIMMMRWWDNDDHSNDDNNDISIIIIIILKKNNIDYFSNMLKLVDILVAVQDPQAKHSELSRFYHMLQSIHNTVSTKF